MANPLAQWSKHSVIIISDTENSGRISATIILNPLRVSQAGLDFGTTVDANVMLPILATTVAAVASLTSENVSVCVGHD